MDAPRGPCGDAVHKLLSLSQYGGRSPGTPALILTQRRYLCEEVPQLLSGAGRDPDPTPVRSHQSGSEGGVRTRVT